MRDDWIRSALEAHKRRDYAGALEACARAPRDRESQARVHAIRATVLSKLARPEEARSEIEAAMRLGADSASLHVLAARIHASCGDRRAARDSIDRALRKEPSSRRLLELREQIVTRMHLLTGLYDHIELTVTLHPTWTAARERLIALLSMLGLYEEAETHVEVAIAQEPHRPELYIRQAVIAIETGKVATAMPALDRALARSESVGERARIARLLVKAGALAKARQTVEENLVRWPGEPEAQVQAASLAVWRGDVRRAESILRHMPSGTPGRAKVAAAVALVAGDDGAALVSASDAVTEDATDGEAHALRAAALFLLARYDEAQHAALTATQNSADWLPAAQLVQLGAQAGMWKGDVRYFDYAEVLRWLRLVVPEITPKGPGEPWRARTVVEAATTGLRRLSGNVTSALTFVGEPSHEWTPLAPIAPARFACVRTAGFIQARPWEWVAERIGALRALYPGSPFVHTHAAELWLWCGEYARCEAECRAALALTKTEGSRWAWVGLGAALMFQERHVEALEVFAESNRLMDPGSPLLAYRGETLRRSGDLAAARNDLARALELGPARVSAWLNLGLISLADGRTDEARAIAAALRRRLPELVDDIGRDAGMAASDVVENPEAIAALFDHALATMRGNRSSGRITYFLSDGEARAVTACALAPF